ncbi:immunoglobulin superfamily member 11 isoform X2 [Brienomyrus brachyistius]|uniref:immunoglobulin superfamily member 11 isoform X2 n=1 Tax=Brienomyrus brachyistius TaxID=42636 RepID=UPI0020B2FA0D|nr:immunoglobulin superfamily member 11 isoform X2 [Brienomyrus brachyistius]
MMKFLSCDLWIPWVVLLCMEGVKPLEVTVSQADVRVARGQTATLSCTFTTSAALTNLNIIWMVIPLSNANQPEQVIIYQGGQVFSLANQLSGRVGFVASMPSTSASIFINNTQLSDTGTYQCLVNNLPDRGGRNIGVIGLTVLVPPSIPHCRVQGSLDVGSDIVLMCGSEEGIPTPTYAWEKLESVPKLPSSAMQDQIHGTVSMRNISTSNSGLYQCTASNAIGKSTCLLNLQVVASLSANVGLIAGTIATSLLAVLICCFLVVVTLVCMKKKSKYEEEEIANEIREDDLPPKRSSSVKAFQADASSSENDTLTSTNTYNSRYWHNPRPKYSTNSYTRYTGDSNQNFSSSPPTCTNGSHTLPPPKTLVVTSNLAPSPSATMHRNGSVNPKQGLAHGKPTHSLAVGQATLERMGAVPVMLPAQSRAGSLV